MQLTKAAANRKKAKKILAAKKSARFYDEKLKKEINEDRQEHGKELKSKDDDEHIDGDGIEVKEQKAKAQQILRADGSIKVNIKRYLHMQ